MSTLSKFSQVGALLIGGIAPTKWIYRSVTDDARSVLDDMPALLGRLSCIGLATTIATEVYTGKVRTESFCKLRIIFGANSAAPRSRQCASWGRPLPYQTAVAGPQQSERHDAHMPLQGVLSLLNFETGTETLTEIEFAVVFLVLLVITNLKSGPNEDSG